MAYRWDAQGSILSNYLSLCSLRSICTYFNFDQMNFIYSKRKEKEVKLLRCGLMVCLDEVQSHDPGVTVVLESVFSFNLSIPLNFILKGLHDRILVIQVIFTRIWYRMHCYVPCCYNDPTCVLLNSRGWEIQFPIPNQSWLCSGISALAFRFENWMLVIKDSFALFLLCYKIGFQMFSPYILLLFPGHCPHDELPQEVNSVICDWIMQIESRLLTAESCC